MIFWFYALDRIGGAKSLAAVCVICAVLYLAASLLLKPNRKPHGQTAVLAGLAAAEFLSALIWLRLFFPGGEYENPGIGGAAWILLYPAFLILAGVCASLWNGRKTGKGTD